MLDGSVVNQEPRLEIVGCVQNAVRTFHQTLNVLWTDVGYKSLHFHLGVDLTQAPLCCHGLRQGAWASASVNSVCRCKLLSSTKSRSMMRSLPTPARHSASA